jgi:hypothetical protein
MKKLPLSMKVAQKITVKKVHKTAPKLLKCDPFVWDALPWGGMEKKMEDPPIHPNMSRMWMELFDRVNCTPLQKLMVQINRALCTLLLLSKS